MQQLQGKTALITGASRGIGHAIASKLAAEGADIVFTHLASDEQGEALAEELRVLGGRVSVYRSDAADFAAVEALVKDVVGALGRLDILVNNAGIYIDDRHSLLTMDMDVMRRTMKTNAYGPVKMCQPLVPLMKQAGYGRVVNVSSGIGELGNLGSSYPAYRTSKIVLNIHTRILARELRNTGILVNAMCPGWVRTDMGGSGAERSVEQGADTVVWLALLPDGGPSGGFFYEREIIPW